MEGGLSQFRSHIIIRFQVINIITFYSSYTIKKLKKKAVINLKQYCMHCYVALRTNVSLVVIMQNTQESLLTGDGSKCH